MNFSEKLESKKYFVILVGFKIKVIFLGTFAEFEEQCRFDWVIFRSKRTTFAVQLLREWLPLQK